MSVIIGVPAQEKGIRPARALPYELDVHASVNASNSTVALTFFNTGSATVVFQVRSGNAADPVRYYTVEPGKTLAGTWNVASSYHLSVYGPNGFVRYFNGSIGSGAAVLDVRSSYDSEVLAAQSHGKSPMSPPTTPKSPCSMPIQASRARGFSSPSETFEDELSLDQFYGWYDLIVTVAGDPTFKYRLAGHVETGKDSFSDPALGGLVTLKAAAEREREEQTV